jgi:exosortase/archaeosortase family protein
MNLGSIAFRTFLIRFFGVFLFLYFGTEAWIGICAKGGIYLPWADQYFNYIDWIKKSLMYGIQWCVNNIWDYQTHFEPNYLIRINGKRGVYIAMGCVGYGVYSFWVAYIIAVPQKIINKMIWVFSGLFLLWIINVLRISMFLVAINEKKTMPLGIDHHTWFNIIAYSMILLLIYFYDKMTVTETKKSL